MSRKKQGGFDINGDSKPIRTAPSEIENGLVKVKEQKFKGRLGKWLCRTLKKPQYIIQELDEKGSFIWKHCDGETTLDEILESLWEEIGDQFESKEAMKNQTLVFLYKLRNLGFITWDSKNESE